MKHSASLMSRILLSLVLLFLLSGCTQAKEANSQVETTYDPNGNLIIQSDRGDTLMAHDLPATIPYNDKTVTLSSVKAYQDKVGYSYRLFVLLRVYANSLNDSEFYWLRTKDCTATVYLTDSTNEYNFDRLQKVGMLYDDSSKGLYYLFTSSADKDNRFEFSDINITACIDAEQTAKFAFASTDGTTSELNKTMSVNYQCNIGSDEIYPATTLNDPSYKQVLLWIDQ